MRVEPEFSYLVAWFNAEKTSGAHDGWCERIADIVIGGKRYSEFEKTGMISRKASSLFARGKALIHTDYQDAIKCIYESLALHLRSFRLNCLSASSYTDYTERASRNTAFDLLRANVRKDTPWEALDHVASLAALNDVFLDPIEGALEEFLANISSLPRRPDLVGRVRPKLKIVQDLFAARDRWLEPEAGRRCTELVKVADQRLAERRDKVGTR
jgi:hypothetical protein